MIEPKICLIGDVLVDVTLKTSSSKIKLRMGGIVHAARCLWALNVPFAVRYFSPAYLDSQIESYLNSLGCWDIKKLGDVLGGPYVFLIEEAKEVGDQGYEFLLRDELTINYNNNLELLRNEKFQHSLLISGNYDISKIVKNVKGLIHIDVANNIEDLALFNQFDSIETIFISTSSRLFKKYYHNDFLSFSLMFSNFANRLILKENRGGSRYINLKNNSIIRGFAQPRKIQHSVGVGDVYNAVFVNYLNVYTEEESLVLASWIAAEYACTTYPDDLKQNVGRILKTSRKDLLSMRGVSLPWEARNKISIYIAAPDFDFVTTDSIDKLVESLIYHNFRPRRPVRENGQMEKNAPKARRQELFHKDMQLLNECSLLIAVLLYNDPGTLIEIGIAYSMGIPTLVYDPNKLADNCMLTELPTLVSEDLDEIISEVFILCNNK